MPRARGDQRDGRGVLRGASPMLRRELMQSNESLLALSQRVDQAECGDISDARAQDMASLVFASTPSVNRNTTSTVQQPSKHVPPIRFRFMDTCAHTSGTNTGLPVPFIRGTRCDLQKLILRALTAL